MTIKRITETLLADLDKKAVISPRLRTNYNLHETPQAPIQRLVVKLRRGTYIRPHRHRERWELGICLQGRMDLVLFDNAGTLTERLTFAPERDNLAIELPAMTWHSWLCVSPAATFLEVKEGPYDPATSSEFAPWAPAEGQPDAGECLQWMEKAQAGEKYNGG